MTPRRRKRSATRALVASFGQEQYRTTSRSRGSVTRPCSSSAGVTRRAPRITFGWLVTEVDDEEGLVRGELGRELLRADPRDA